MIKKFLFLTTLFLLAFGGGKAWAEYAVFSFSSSSSPTTVSGISISGGSMSTGYYHVASGATLTIAAESGKTITAISFTFTENKVDRNGGDVTTEVGTYTPNGASASWAGSASSVSLTTTNKMRISGLTVTYTTDAASPSADLGAPDYTHGYKWDFTNISMTNIAADETNWELNGTKYQNKGALTNANLIANSAYIPETKYLTFSATTANNLWLSNTSDYKYLAINQDGSLKIPEVTAGKTVIIGWFNGTGSSVTASVTNATNVDGGAASISTSATQDEVTEAYLTATGGDITLTPNGWAYFKYIIIADKKTITVSDMKFSPKVNSQGLCASDGLDRTLGGFGFAFTGGQGIKYNNTTNLLIRNDDSSNTGVITITPQKSSTGTITIPRVDIAVNSGYTGLLSANGGSAESISSVSSHSFSNLSGETFTLTGVSGQVFIESFTIYYTDFAGVLNETMITPTITWSKSSDALTTTDGYVSPTITTSPANFDISIASNNTDVATVAADNWTGTAGIVSLTGTGGNATITASSTASTFFNAATAATYTISLNNSYEKWNFTSLDVTNTITGDTGWNGASGWEAYPSSGTVQYYKNVFTASGRGTESTYAPTSPSQLEGLKFARDNSSGLAAGQIRLYNDHMYFNNNNIMIKVPVTAGDNVLVTFDGGNGSTQAGFSFSNATLEGDDAATRILSDDTQRTATLIATETGYVTLTVTNSKVNLYRIQVVTDERDALTQFRPLGSQTYEYTKSGAVTTTNNYTIYFQPTGALVKDVDESNIHVVSSDPSVLNVSSVGVGIAAGSTDRIALSNIQLGEGGTAYLTVTFDGNASYKPATTTTPVFTIHAPSSFLVQVEDQQIQQGQRSQLTPVITDKDGNLIGIRYESGVYSTYVLGEDEDVPDYTNYFDFSYVAGSGTGENYTYIEVDDETGAVTTRSGDNMAAVGATREISITATPKSAYASLFSSASANTTATMTIIEAAAAIELNFYWNSGCTSTYQVKAPANASDLTQDYKLGDTETSTSANIGVFGKSGTFASGFPNGRMLYVTTNENSEGDEIWFSYAKNKEAATLTPDRNIDKNKHIYQYRRGIPIYIDEELAAGDYIFVNVVAVHKNPETGLWGLNGGVARMKFFMTSHSRPAAPTYDPVSPDADASKNNTTDAKFEDENGGKIMDTSENVVAYGEGASKTTEGNGNLVYGKFSTSSIYTTEQLINEAHVVQGINSVPVVSTEVAKRRFTTVQIKTEAEGADYISYQTHTEYWYLYDTRLTVTPSGNQYINVNASTSEPTTTVQWYNKATPGWQDVNNKTVTFSIVSRNGASDAAVNSSTGVVTAGSNTGWVRVKASYEGGEWHGKTDGEPQYRSQTAPSETYFYVYISDPLKEEPLITPPTRKFTTIQNYTIQAPATWDVWYTVNGSDPATSGTRYALTHGTSINGVATETVTVRAIAYNPNATASVSREVSETYTKVDPLPDPIFDPDGVPQPYHYYTSSLTVQIACAYAGSVIYYTVDGSDPEMGAANTYKYSGLEKVVISGNVSIKAVAYDPENDLFSNVVTSNYMYSSDMEMPYFQISNDGSTWTGKYNNGETVDVTPKTQIRIVDPNSMKGTIYYTLDGDMPGDNASSLTYVDGYPFTVAKTTTGNAIVILEEASSSVATATFLINSSDFPVWEAVEETTPGGVMAGTYGFVISTDPDLPVANSASKVNLKSIASGNSSHITYAQQYITATFGGFDLIDWSVLTLPDDAIGTPIDGVGDYTIKNATNDAKDEKGVMYNHRNSLDANCPQTHDKTFKLPSQGAYVKFEPERDGDLTIWGLQQGAIQYSEDVALCDKFIRRRAVYFVDEQGKSYPVKKVNGVPQLWSSARLSANWTRVAANYNNWTPLHTTDDNVGYQEALINGHMTKVYNNFYTNEESNAIYNMYESYLTTNGISVGDPIKPFPIHTGNTLTWKDGQDADASNDGTGYVMPSGGFVKYTFEVKAGKTYFFFGHLTKVGIRGFQFIPTETVSLRPKLTLKTDADPASSVSVEGGSNMSLASAVSSYDGRTVNVTVERTFKANTWTSLVLPFSVSVSQIEKVFGDFTDIVLFDDVRSINNSSDSEIHLLRHWHKMVVAGTPLLIKPTNGSDIDNPEFEGVQLETSVVDDIVSSNGYYKMTGTFINAENALKKWDYYINSTGNFSYMTGDQATVKGTRSWLKVLPANPNPSRLLSVAFSDFDDEGSTTGIINVEMSEASNNGQPALRGVYNLKGQKVSDGSLENLPKGIYIVNGKKKVVE